MERPSWASAGVRLLVVAAVLALTFWLVFRLVAEASWTSVWAELRQARFGWVALAAVLKLGVLAAWAGRWQLTAHRLDRSPPGWVLWAAHAAGVLANHVAPFARLLGGLVRARFLRASSRLSAARALGVVVFDQAVHLLTMGALTGLALVAAAALLGRSGLAAALAGSLLAAAALLGLALRRRGIPLTESLADALAARAEGRSGRLLRGAGAAAQAVSELAAAKPLRRWAVLLGGLLFALNALSQWAVFLALGARVSLGVVAVAVALGAAAGMLVATPGGIGGTEAAMIALYGLFGVDPASGAAGTLLFRAVHYAVVFAAGVPAYALLELRLARSPETGRSR